MTRRRRWNGYISLRAVAALLHHEWSVAEKWRLLRAMKAKERATGKQVLWRKGGESGHYYTTESVLRHNFPEWFNSRDAVAEVMTANLSHLEDRMLSQEKRLRVLGDLLSAHLRSHASP